MRDDVCFITLAYIGEAPIATHIQVVGDRILELGKYQSLFLDIN
jgi:hypothetical protein